MRNYLAKLNITMLLLLLSVIMAMITVLVMSVF